MEQGGYYMSGYFDERNGRLWKTLEDLRRWNWSCCRFAVLPGNSRRVSGIASRTEQGGCLRYSVLDAGLSCTKGVWYIYDWDTG